jgi:hypothetical protein
VPLDSRKAKLTIASVTAFALYANSLDIKQQNAAPAGPQPKVVGPWPEQVQVNPINHPYVEAQNHAYVRIHNLYNAIALARPSELCRQYSTTKMMANVFPRTLRMSK